MRALGEAADRETTVYLVGGATAVLEGWRPTTIDVDVGFEPESDALLHAIARLKNELEINVELATPADFIPVRAGWQERSPYVDRIGRVTFRHFDLTAQMLAKLERGHDRDLADVDEMLARGLVDRATVRQEYEHIEGELFRFPAIDADAFRARVDRALSD